MFLFQMCLDRCGANANRVCSFWNGIEIVMTSCQLTFGFTVIVYFGNAQVNLPIGQKIDDLGLNTTVWMFVFLFSPLIFIFVNGIAQNKEIVNRMRQQWKH